MMPSNTDPPERHNSVSQQGDTEIAQQALEQLLCDNRGIVFQFELADVVGDRVSTDAIEAAIDRVGQRDGVIVLALPDGQAIYDPESAPSAITSLSHSAGDNDG